MTEANGLKQTFILLIQKAQLSLVFQVLWITSSLRSIVKIRKSKEDSSLTNPTNRVPKHTDSARCINTVGELMATYPGQFDNIGKFPGEYHIVLEEENHPVIHAPRKCPTLKR